MSGELEMKTEEEIREVFDKYLNDFGHVCIDNVESALLWYYGINGYTEKDIQTGKSIAPDMKRMAWCTNHRFKLHEWKCSKKELIQALADYQKEEWTRTNVEQFLDFHIHLTSGFIELHHVRCVWTLIRNGVVERYMRRLSVE